MLLVKDELELIRKSCKDEEAFQTIVELFNRRLSHDIEEEHQHVRQTESLYESLVDTLPMNIYRIDVDGCLTFGNKYLLDALNLSLDDLVGKTAYDFYPESDAQKYRDDDANVIRTGKMFHFIEENVLPTTGETRFVETFKIPIYDENNNIIGIQGIFWDITERKQAEDAIRKSENRANALLDAIPDTVVQLDVDGIFIDYVEGSDESLFIKHIDQLLGSHVSDVFSPHIAKLFEDNIRRTLRSNFAVTFEYRIDISEEDFIDNEVRMVKVSDREVIVIIRDTTQRNLAAQRELDFKLEIERGDLLTEFIQDAAHEFRTPLATIETNLYLLSKGELLPSTVKRLEKIRSQTNRISRLVDNQLMIVKLNHPQNLTFKHIDMLNLVENVKQTTLKTYGDRPELVVTCSENVPKFFGSEYYLLAALYQLMDNAYQFTPEDGKILLQVSHDDAQVNIDLYDEGSGIPEESLPYVFNLFWRRDDAHTTPGFGLGLAITKKVVDMLNGDIQIQNRTPKGTHVHVSLPLKAI